MQRLKAKLGPEGLRISGQIQRIYRTTGVRESVVSDREEIVVKKVTGATEWDSEVNAAMFRRLLAD